MDCTPSALVQDARCLSCIPPHNHLSVQTYLLYAKSGLSLTVSELTNAAKCYACLQGMQQAAHTYILCRILESLSVVAPTEVILQDANGQFWQVIVDPSGLVGAQSGVGPKTPDVILQDANGAFWKLIVNTDGLIGTESHAGPKTLAPQIDDGAGTIWTIMVGTDGGVGASS